MKLHIFLVDIISVKIGIYPILVVKKVSNTATHTPKIPWKTVFLIIHKTQKVALRRTTFLHILFIFKHLFTWAVNGAWTRDPQLGKLVLYQLSYYRKVERIKEKAIMEPIPGLEPGTHALRMRCSTNWAISAFPICLMRLQRYLFYFDIANI